MGRSRDRAHPFLAKLQKLAAAYPETSEVETWGHPTFRVRDKIFASFGEYDGRSIVGCKQTHADQAILVESDGIEVAKYVGRHGWVSIDADVVGWPTIAELVDTSYRLIAPRTLVALLDEA